MDYRLLINEAGLGFSQSVSLLWVAERPHHHHSSSCHFELSHNTFSISPKWLSVSEMALHAYWSISKGHNPKQKKGKKGWEFWLCKRYPETSVLPLQISKWHGGEKDLSMSRYILNATKKKIIVILFLQSWNTSTESS